MALIDKDAEIKRILHYCVTRKCPRIYGKGDARCAGCDIAYMVHELKNAQPITPKVDTIAEKLGTMKRMLECIAYNLEQIEKEIDRICNQ